MTLSPETPAVFVGRLIVVHRTSSAGKSSFYPILQNTLETPCAMMGHSLM